LEERKSNQLEQQLRAARADVDERKRERLYGWWGGIGESGANLEVEALGEEKKKKRLHSLEYAENEHHSPEAKPRAYDGRTEKTPIFSNNKEEEKVRPSIALR